MNVEQTQDLANAAYKKLLNSCSEQIEPIVESGNWGTGKEQLDQIYSIIHKSSADLSHEELMAYMTMNVLNEFSRFALKGIVIDLLKGK